MICSNYLSDIYRFELTVHTVARIASAATAGPGPVFLITVFLITQRYRSSTRQAEYGYCTDGY